MFPNTRLAQVLLGFATLIFALAIALPPVSFRVTDLGLRVNGMAVSLVGNSFADQHATGTELHFAVCKFVGSRGVCVHKELSWDHAHGLHLAAEMTSRPPTEI
jgi:hypothetical protein